MALTSYKVIAAPSTSELSQLVQSEIDAGKILVGQMWLRSGIYCQCVGHGTMDKGTVTDYHIVSSPSLEPFSQLVTSQLYRYQPIGLPVVYNSALFQVMGVVTPSESGDARELVLSVQNGWLESQYEGDTEWTQLYNLESLTPHLSVGTVTTVAAGTSAAVTLNENVLNFSIPRGADAVLSMGTVTTGATPSANIVGGKLNIVLPAAVNGVSPTLSVGTVSTLPAGSNATVSITGTSPSYTINFGIPRGDSGVSYNPQTPVSRTVTIGTAYQHTDTTKPYRATVNVRATQTLTVAGTAADRVELRIGSTAAAVASGGSGGFSVAVWESGITGIALMIGAGIQDGGVLMFDIPAGWYFQVNRVSGTNASIVSCYTQSMVS